MCLWINEIKNIHKHICAQAVKASRGSSIQIMKIKQQWLLTSDGQQITYVLRDNSNGQHAAQHFCDLCAPNSTSLIFPGAVASSLKCMSLSVEIESACEIRNLWITHVTLELIWAEDHGIRMNLLLKSLNMFICDIASITRYLNQHSAIITRHHIVHSDTDDVSTQKEINHDIYVFCFGTLKTLYRSKGMSLPIIIVNLYIFLWTCDEIFRQLSRLARNFLFRIVCR